MVVSEVPQRFLKGMVVDVAKIIQLDQHVADLIAAGEVVEKPASVVKELLENSIDSGAGIITVEISGGGMKHIRVTDNGSGIASEDAEIAFLRHATSKLRNARGLEAIGTLGFRGEALAAIAAVSKIEMQTRRPENKEGTLLRLEAGKVINKTPVGCPEGTTITVKDLFFNTPARLKFMKSDRAEGSALSALVMRIALSRPDISIRFIKDNKQEYHTPGDNKIDSVIYSLLGREMKSGLISAESTDEAISVKGYVSKPSGARGNRGYQFYFVNGRIVKSQLLQAALEQAYRNILPSGRFPSCVLYIESGLNTVDVNVHPAKTEIKFVSDKQFYDGVYYATIGALEKDARLGTRQGEGSSVLHETLHSTTSPTQNYRRDGYQSPADVKYNHKPNSTKTFQTLGVEEYSKIYKTPPRQGDARQGDGSSVSYQPSNFAPTLAPTNPSLLPQSPYRIIGETMSMYIIVEQDETVLFIDKHAAHERIHFDALRGENYKPMSESLLTPVICRLGHEAAATMLESADFLDDLGFAIESFGEDQVAVRYIPAEIEIDDAEQTLSEICEKLKQSGIAETEKRDNIYKTIACKAAIKAGRSSEQQELEKLAEKVMFGEITHCPHGRPIVYKLTKNTLDKNLGRA